MWLEVCRLTGSGRHFLCFTTLAAGSAKTSTPHLAGTGRAVTNHQMVHFLEPCKVSLSNLIICCVLRITPAEVCHGHQNLPTVVTPLSKPRIGFHEAPANIPTVAQHLYPPWSLPLGSMARKEVAKRYSLVFFTSYSQQINFQGQQFGSHSVSH